MMCRLAVKVIDKITLKDFFFIKIFVWISLKVDLYKDNNL